jgi:pilus assembly protein Flp/PilA
MRRLAKFVKEFLREEDGPTAVEYAVMLALILIVCAVAIQFVGETTNNTFNAPKLSNALNSGS